jgi:hypothetical protein
VIFHFVYPDNYAVIPSRSEAFIMDSSLRFAPFRMTFEPVIPSRSEAFIVDSSLRFAPFRMTFEPVIPSRSEAFIMDSSLRSVQNDI